LLIASTLIRDLWFACFFLRNYAECKTKQKRFAEVHFLPPLASIIVRTIVGRVASTFAGEGEIANVSGVLRDEGEFLQ
jgi:hypothetical protein